MINRGEVVKKRMVSIGVKLLIPVFLCFVVFGASLMVTINLLTRSTSAATFKEGINQKDNLVYQLIDEETVLLEKKARWFGEFAGSGGLIAGREAETGPEPETGPGLQAQLDALLLALDVDGIALADRNGYLLINSGASGSSNGSSGGARYVKTIVSYTEGRDCVTRMYSLDNTLELISAAPVFSGGELAGYCFIEYSLQSAKFVNALQSLTQCEIDLYQGPALRGSSDGLSPGVSPGTPDSESRKSWITPFTGSLSSDHDLMIDAVLGLGETFRGEYAVGGVTYYGVHIPLKDGSGSRVGIVSMSLPMTTVGQTVQLIDRVVLPLLLGGITALLLVFILLLRLVVIAPLKHTAVTAAAVSENLSSREADFTYQMPVKRRDEIAVIIRSINGFIASLRTLVSRLKDAQASLHAIGENLTGQSEESAKANERIMDAAAAIQGQTEDQGKSLERTTAVLQNASEGLGGLNALILDQNKAITASSASVEEMSGAIAAVSVAMRENEGTVWFAGGGGRRREKAAGGCGPANTKHHRAVGIPGGGQSRHCPNCGEDQPPGYERRHRGGPRGGRGPGFRGGGGRDPYPGGKRPLPVQFHQGGTFGYFQGGAGYGGHFRQIPGGLPACFRTDQRHRRLYRPD
jgi:hypothetical protein